MWTPTKCRSSTRPSLQLIKSNACYSKKVVRGGSFGEIELMCAMLPSLMESKVF